MKAGIIRCQQTEDMCVGAKDFAAAAAGKDAFAQAAPVEIMGFVSCGGCPGKRAVARAKFMLDREVGRPGRGRAHVPSPGEVHDPVFEAQLPPPPKRDLYG